MKIRLMLIFLIAFSIAVQNTCPYGLAGKIGFTAKEVHKCYLPAKADADDSSEKIAFRTGQAFVFTIGHANNAAFISFQEIARFSPEITNLYKNVFSEPAIKPPPLV